MSAAAKFRVRDLGAPPRRQLTARQRAVFEFVRDFIAGRGYPPTLRDICKAFGFRSTTAATGHLRAIQRKGWISRAGKLSRGITVVRPAPLGAAA